MLTLSRKELLPIDHSDHRSPHGHGRIEPGRRAPLGRSEQTIYNDQPQWSSGTHAPATQIKIIGHGWPDFYDYISLGS